MSYIPIYTGYFNKIKTYQENNLYPISIARGTPKFVGNVAQYPNLQPHWYMIQDYKFGQYTNDVEHYTKHYNEITNILNIDRVYDELIQMSNGKSPILLCWEAPDKFCHRQLVAKWLGTKYPILEY